MTTVVRGAAWNGSHSEEQLAALRQELQDALAKLNAINLYVIFIRNSSRLSQCSSAISHF
jgi:hypothetical protein